MPLEGPTPSRHRAPGALTTKSQMLPATVRRSVTKTMVHKIYEVHSWVLSDLGNTGNEISFGQRKRENLMEQSAGAKAFVVEIPLPQL